MHHEIELPNSVYIDTTLGLKYLNGNKKLYLKVLNSFLTRYQTFDVNTLNENEFKDSMHVLKGLSSTLGMKKLSILAEQLNESKTDSLLLEFSETLLFIIADLTRGQDKSILIIHDDYDDIDTLVNNLDDNYDLIIAINLEDAFESISKEKVNYVLLNKKISNQSLIEKLKEKNISIIYLSKPVNMNIIRQKL